MTRIIYTTPPATQQIITSTPRPGSDLAAKTEAAGLIAAAVAVLVLLLLLLLASLANPSHPLTWTQVRDCTVASLVTGTITGACLLLRWVWETVTRPWRLENEDRRLSRAIAARVETGEAPPRSPSAGRIEIVVFQLLQRHAAGKATTREGCEKAAVCTQAEWNLASRALHVAGLKKGNTIVAPPDLNQAWPLWQARSYQDSKGTLWVGPKEGKHQPIT